MLTALIALLAAALLISLYLLLRHQQREARLMRLLEYAEGSAVRIDVS